MIGITNSGFGGSGGIAFIQVTYPVGSSCSCTNGTRTYRAKDTSGSCVFNVKDPGNWMVSCIDGTDSDSKTVTIANYDSISVKLNYESMERLADDVAGWNLPMLISAPGLNDIASNEYYYLVNTSTPNPGANDILVRASKEPVIFIPFSSNATRDGWGIGVITSTAAIIAYTGGRSLQLNNRAYDSNLQPITYFTTQNGYKLYLNVDPAYTTGTTGITYGMHTVRDGQEYTKTGTGIIADTDANNKPGINIAINFSSYQLECYGTQTATRDANLAKFNEALNRYALLTGAEAVTS